MSNEILLRGNPGIREVKATAAITPGHLVDKNTGAVHASAGGNAAPVFADRQIGKLPDDAYASGDTVALLECQGAEGIFALVAAEATAITKGAPLESAGDGTLRLHVPQAVDEGGTATYTINTRAIVAYASEAVDNSAGETPVRIKVEAV